MKAAGKGWQIMAGAALAASVIGGALLARGDVPSVPAPRAPDYFAFVRPLPETMTSETPHREAGPDPRWRAVFERQLEMAGDGSVPYEAIARELGGMQPEARSVLDKYLRYRRQLGPLQAAMDAGRDVAAAISAMRTLRADLFSASEREALFPADEAYESFLLARHAIISDAAFGEDERHQRLLQLEATLSPEARQTEELRTGIVRIMPSLQPGGEEDVYRLAPAQ